MIKQFIYKFNQNKKISNKYIFNSKTIGYLLTFVAGMMGVYSYNLTNGIFSNGLTGDVLYIGINLSKGNISKALVYLFVVVSFSIGVIISYHFRKKFAEIDVDENGFRRVGMLVETLLVLASYFFSNNLICLFLITVSLGIQIEIFDNIRNYGLSTVNYVGNTKNAAEYIGKYIEGDNKDGLLIAISYYIAFLFFIVGGGISHYLYVKIGKEVSFVCVVVLTIIFLLSIIIIKDKEVKRII